MDIQVIVQHQLEKIIKDGKLEEIVRAKVEKTIEDVIYDTVRSYSDFGKGLKEEINKAFKIDFERISAVDYNHIVVSIVKDHLDQRLVEYAKEPITKEIDEYLGPLEKKEWKLSEIVERFKQDELGDEEKYSGGEITLHVEKSNYGSTHIAIDKDDKKKRYDCEFEMSINTKTGILYLFRSGKWHPHNGDLRSASIHGSFDKFLFRLYAQKATIIIDECDTEYYYDND